MRPSRQWQYGGSRNHLRALGWVLCDDRQADRLLALTGLDAAELGQRADQPAILNAVIEFLRAHEPDLITCAEALEVTPDQLARLGRELAR